MGKKNKKREYESDNQRSVLEMLNAAIDSGDASILSGNYDAGEEEDDVDFFGNLSAGLNERLGITDDDDDEDEENNDSDDEFTVDRVSNVYEETSDEEKDDSEVTPNTEFSIKMSTEYTGLKIDLPHSDVFQLIRFDDGIRSITLDLSTIDPDDAPIDEEINTNLITMARLEEVLTMFYPSAILFKDEINNKLANLSDYDCEKFFFFAEQEFDVYPNVIFGYYIDEESIANYKKFVELATKVNKYVNFMNTMYEIFSSEGFTFRNIIPDITKDMAMLDIFTEKRKEFYSLLIGDIETELEGDGSKKIVENNIIAINPFDYNVDIVDNTLGTFIYDGDDDEEEFDPSLLSDVDDEEEEESTEVVPSQVIGEKTSDVNESNEAEPSIQFNVKEDNSVEESSEEPKEETVEETPEDVSDDASDDMSDDTDSNLFDGVEDAEDYEAEYYRSKGQKPPKQNPRPNPKKSDDGEFVVTRR